MSLSIAVVQEKVQQAVQPEAEFLDVVREKVLRIFLLAIHSHLSMLFTVTSGLKLVCNVNIVDRNLKSENSQDYAQKPQRDCTFTNSTSRQIIMRSPTHLSSPVFKSSLVYSITVYYTHFFITRTFNLPYIQ